MDIKCCYRQLLVQIPVVCGHVALAFLFFFCWHSQTAIGQTTLAPPVVVPCREQIDNAHRGRKAEEGKTDDITVSVQRGIFLEERICRDNSADWDYQSAIDVSK